jgi:hypothetical protein
MIVAIFTGAVPEIVATLLAVVTPVIEKVAATVASWLWT